MSACRQCGAGVTCGCQLTADSLCSTCAMKAFEANKPQGSVVYPPCEYNIGILQMWRLKLEKLVKDNTYDQIGLNGFQLNHYLQLIANALSMGQATQNYCFYQDQLNPIKDIIIVIGQKLKF